MSPKQVKKASGIKLTQVRAEVVVPVTVDFGAFGTGEMGVRPLLYNDNFIKNIDKQMLKLMSLAGSDDEDVNAEAMDSIQKYLLPLVAWWDIQAPLDEILKAEGFDLDIDFEERLRKVEKWETEFLSLPEDASDESVVSERDIAKQEFIDEEGFDPTTDWVKYKKRMDKFIENLGEPIFDEESNQNLYKLPVTIKSMRLFPILGKTSGIDAILKAVGQIELFSTGSIAKQSLPR